jgi:hypothetical protein
LFLLLFCLSCEFEALKFYCQKTLLCYRRNKLNNHVCLLADPLTEIAEQMCSTGIFGISFHDLKEYLKIEICITSKVDSWHLEYPLFITIFITLSIPGKHPNCK